MITQERLKQLLLYDPETGYFYRDGAKCGYDNGRGYMKISLEDKEYYLHRLAWLYMTGSMPSVIDHIDRNKSNNCFSNLREVTLSQNSHNRGMDARNKTGVTGVFYKKQTKQYIAYISVKGQRKHLGVFETLEEAAQCRKKEEEAL
jgi:hypothetical protein